MLKIVASLIDAARGVIYDRHMFVVQATVRMLCLRNMLSKNDDHKIIR